MKHPVFTMVITLFSGGLRLLTQTELEQMRDATELLVKLPSMGLAEIEELDIDDPPESDEMHRECLKLVKAELIYRAQRRVT